ncbi:hypothetical protein [Desulforhopalus sp. 52FAK]
MPTTPSTADHAGASGHCPACNCTHHLPMGTSNTRALELIQQLSQNETIHLSQGSSRENNLASTQPLWGEPRGKMFGILECVTAKKKPVLLYAFSGQFNGQWQVDGWVPPLFNVDDFHALNDQREKEIKALTYEIEQTTAQTERWLDLRKLRRNKSRQLMIDIHSLYRLTNFRGETKTLQEVFKASKNIPTGTGDCCAPKLLNHAAKNGLIPTGICEFFYGRQTKSGSHKHGDFSSPCLEKCAPILGFMLCGLQDYKG